MAKLGKAATKVRGRAPKIKQVASLEKIFRDGDGIVFFNNNGLSVEQATELRSLLRDKGSTMKVAKNTFIKLAMDRAGIETAPFERDLTGPTVVAAGFEDPVSTSKILLKFLKDREAKIEIKAGVLESARLDAAGVDALSKTPGREEMLSSIVGSLQAPAQNLVFALNACVSKVVWALSAYQKKMEESGEAA